MYAKKWVKINGIHIYGGGGGACQQKIPKKKAVKEESVGPNPFKIWSPDNGFKPSGQPVNLSERMRKYVVVERIIEEAIMGLLHLPMHYLLQGTNGSIAQ